MPYVVQCPSGHHFDLSKFRYCPFCGAPAVMTPVQPEEQNASAPPAVPTAESNGYAPSAVPTAESNGSAPPAVPTAESNGYAPSAVPTTAESNGYAPSAVPPTAESNGYAPSAVPTAESNGYAPSAVPTAESNGYAPPAVPTAESNGYALQTVPATAPTCFAIGGEKNTHPTAGWLVGMAGPCNGKSYPVREGRNLIGRSAEMDIVLSEDPAVSLGVHAVVTYVPTSRTYYAQTGYSRELYAVNGEPVIQTVPLAADDQLTVGTSVFRFVPLCGKDFGWDNVTAN